MIESHHPLNEFPPTLICWGAADQARVMRPIIERVGGKIDVLVDDTPNLESPYKDIELLGGKDAFEAWLKGRSAKEIGFTLAIGNPYGHVRCQLHDYLVDKGLVPVSIADPSAHIDDSAIIGPGAQIMCQSTVHVDARLGKQVIVNTQAICEHDDILHDGVELAPGANLCGRVEVGRYSWVCANATVIPRTKIGENCIVAAGSVVIQDVADNLMVAGNPAQQKKVR